jgi:hypothetical protein
MGRAALVRHHPHCDSVGDTIGAVRLASVAASRQYGVKKYRNFKLTHHRILEPLLLCKALLYIKLNQKRSVKW